MKGRTWNMFEVKLLQELYGIVPTNVLCTLLNRSKQSVYSKAHRLGLSDPRNKGRKFKFINIIVYDIYFNPYLCKF